MSSGIQHAAATKVVGNILTVVGTSVWVLTGIPAVLALPLGGWASHWCSPDQDHHKITYMEGLLLRKNRLVGTLWIWYWKPYEKLHPHRGTSHTWPKGTIVRMAYLFWFPIILSYWFVSSSSGWFSRPIFDLCFWWFFMFVGWSTQDFIHLWMDGE